MMLSWFTGDRRSPMNEITLNSIDFNFEKLKADVETAVQQYVDFKVTSGTVSDAKKALADIRKMRTSFSDSRIATKAPLVKAAKDFDDRCKLIDAVFEEQINRLDRGVKEYEDLEKSAKTLEIEMFFDTLSSPVELIKIWSTSWLNSSVSEKQWKTELTEKVQDIKEKLSLIPMLNIDDTRLLTNLYLESLDLTKAQEQYSKLVVDVSEQNIIIEEVKQDEPMISTQIELFATQKQIDMVFRFMREHKITFMEGIV